MRFTQSEIAQLQPWFESRRTPMYRTVEDFRGLGVTDTGTWTAALEWQQETAGRVLGVPMHSYTLTSWTTVVTTIPLVLAGVGQAESVVTGPGGSVDFIDAQSGVVVSNMSFDTWDVVFLLNPTADHDLVSFRRVAFASSTRALYAASLSGTVTLSTLRVEECEFTDLTGQAIVYSGAVAMTTVRSCRFTNVASRAVQIGKDVSTAAINPATGVEYTIAEVTTLQDSWRRTTITNNIIDGITSVTGGTAENSIIALIVYGQQATIRGNILTGLVSTALTKENDAIYTKCREAIVTHNIISAVSGGSAQFCINIKGRAYATSPTGVQGYGTTVATNRIDCGSTAGIGIRLQNERVRVEGNTIKKPTSTAIYLSSGVTVEDAEDPDITGYSDIAILHNHISDGAGLPGINCTAVGSRITIKNNDIDGFETGVQVVLNPLTTTLNATALSGATSVSVTNYLGFVVGRTVNITRNDAVVQSFTVASVTAGTYPAGTIGLSGSLGGDANSGNTITQNYVGTTPTAYVIDQNTITRSTFYGIRVLPAIAMSSVSVCNNMIDGGTNPAGSAYGIRFDPSASIAGLTCRGNKIHNIQPSSNGYGIAFLGTAVADALVDDNTYVNVKTTNLSFTTTPTLLRGTFTGSVASAAGSVVNAGATSRTVTVPGAQDGMIPTATIEGLLTAGVSCTGAITAADTVSVRILNNSGGTITLTTSMTVRASVTRR